jgi:hypothetical protein
MMTSGECYRRAEFCESKAAECINPVLQREWLGSAADWRALCGDENAQATTARLVSIARQNRRASLE